MSDFDLTNIGRMKGIIRRSNIRHGVFTQTAHYALDYCEHLEAQLTAANARADAIVSAGWRSCIDHIIKPNHPCPVCALEAATARADALEKENEQFMLSITGLNKDIRAANARADELTRILRLVVSMFERSREPENLISAAADTYDYAKAEVIETANRMLQGLPEPKQGNCGHCAQPYGSNERADAYRDTLRSIAANSCCEGCQEARRVAISALEQTT